MKLFSGLTPRHTPHSSPRALAAVPSKIQNLKFKITVCLCVLLTSWGHSAVIYSGLQDQTVPNTLDGLYLNIATGATTGSFPADWNSKPYVNPFFGGVAIATSDLFLPVIMGADQIVNAAYASLIDSTLTFATAENASATHVGAGPGQFTLGTEGYMGYAFQSTIGGPTYYGWARIVINNSGSGVIRDWAYQDVAGAGLLAGTLTSTPEPGRVTLLMAGMLVVGLRRRRFNT